MPLKENDHVSPPPEPQGLAGRGHKQQKTTTPITEERKLHNARIRDNQQRARARRKELLDDLQRRVADYERRGVQATLEMQQAARRVAGENARLRALLTAKGVSESEVEGWLRHEDEGAFYDQDVAMESVRSGTAPRITGVGVVYKGRPVNELPPPTPPASTPGYHAAPTPPASTAYYYTATALPASVAGYYTAPASSARYLSHGGTNSSTSPSSRPTSRDPAPSLSDLVDACCSSGTETSCEVAAAILANMQGHGDTRRSRAALGCADSGDCTVKNTRVLELLDEAG